MATIVLLLLQLLSFALFARAVLSWFNIGPTSSIYPFWSALRRGTEPIVAINVIGIPVASRL